MFCVLDVLGFRRFCFGHILDVLGLDVLGLDVLVLDVLGEHDFVDLFQIPRPISFTTEL